MDILYTGSEGLAVLQILLNLELLLPYTEENKKKSVLGVYQTEKVIKN